MRLINFMFVNNQKHLQFKFIAFKIIKLKKKFIICALYYLDNKTVLLKI